ncbi:MAG: zinc ribbon domain-containing protein [Ardenticatenaceae bacterium]|nr:zinc ribbon domain-containing protein [Ardenticatenaceae bacterium]MCB9444712.1 zinc ribbon domain-containing protein [Ardenticatenaceae bacterium]
MFIIFGTRQRTVKDHEATATTFRCPHCQQIAQFEPVKIRNYFALFFVPLIPLEKGKPAYRCTNCQTKFARQVVEAGKLHRDTKSIYGEKKENTRIMKQISVDCTFNTDGSVRVQRVEIEGSWWSVEQGRQWVDENGRHVLIMLPNNQVREIILRADSMAWEMVTVSSDKGPRIV